MKQIKPEFYEDFEDNDGMIFHRRGELAGGKVGLRMNTNQILFF